MPEHTASLRGVAVALDASRAADEDLRRAVETAREAGETWADIGEVLGTSRQAAFQRFGRPVAPQVDGPRAAQGAELLPHAAELAVDVLVDFLNGRWDAVRERFDPTMSEAVSTGQLSGSLAAVLDSVGNYEGMDQPYARRIGDYTTVDVLLRFEAGEMIARVHFRDDGLIAGMWLRPPGQPQPV